MRLIARWSSLHHLAIPTYGYAMKTPKRQKRLAPVPSPMLPRLRVYSLPCTKVPILPHGTEHGAG